MNGIKRYRLATGLTQEELAQLIHKTKGCVCLYEKGVRTPSIAVAKEIAAVVGCSLDELFREE